MITVVIVRNIQKDLELCFFRLILIIKFRSMERSNKKCTHQSTDNSNEPLAVAIRERLASTANKDADITEDSLFKVIHPHTELCIDLKLLTLEPGRIKVGDFIGGVITRDSEDHYTFLQNASEKRILVL